MESFLGRSAELGKGRQLFVGCLMTKFDIGCWQPDGLGDGVHAKFSVFCLVAVEEACYESRVLSVAAEKVVARNPGFFVYVTS